MKSEQNNVLLNNNKNINDSIKTKISRKNPYPTSTN